MELKIESHYFGDVDAMMRWVDGTLAEIDKIDQIGREHSKAPDRFLSDCYPELLTIKVILENFKRHYDEYREDFREVLK